MCQSRTPSRPGRGLAGVLFRAVVNDSRRYVLVAVRATWVAQSRTAGSAVPSRGYSSSVRSVTATTWAPGVETWVRWVSSARRAGWGRSRSCWGCVGGVRSVGHHDTSRFPSGSSMCGYFAQRRDQIWSAWAYLIRWFRCSGVRSVRVMAVRSRAPLCSGAATSTRCTARAGVTAGLAMRALAVWLPVRSRRCRRALPAALGVGVGRPPGQPGRCWRCAGRRPCQGSCLRPDLAQSRHDQGTRSRPVSGGDGGGEELPSQDVSGWSRAHVAGCAPWRRRWSGRG